MVDNVLSPPQTFYNHLSEIRKRLAWSALFFIIGSSVGYLARDYLITLLKKPLNESLYYTTPAGSFNFVMKISVMVGLSVALPIFVYNLVAFVRPAFTEQLTKKTVKTISFLSVFLAILGAIFAFFLVVPMSLSFFQGFSEGDLKPLIAADNYLTFVINCIISFVLIFQTPLIVLFIDRIKPIPPKKLFKYERHVIVGSLVLALILPFTYDPLTQFLIAIPIIVLYNLAIILVWLIHRKTNNKLNIAKISNQKNTVHNNSFYKGNIPKHTNLFGDNKLDQNATTASLTMVGRGRNFDILDLRQAPTSPVKLTVNTNKHKPRTNLAQPERVNFLDLRKPKDKL